MKKLFYIIGILLIAFNVSATPYYVDATDGSDSNTGLSHAQAWKTLAKVAAEGLSLSDDVYLLCGETWTEEKLTVNWSGDVGDQAIIGAYYIDGSETVGVNGDGKPIIDGNNSYPAVNTEALIYINDDKAYVTVQDIEIRESDGYGVFASTDTDHITVQRCVIDTTFRSAVIFYTGSDYGTVEYCEMTNIGLQELLGGGWPQAVNNRKNQYGVIRFNSLIGSYGEGLAIGDYGVMTHNLVVDTKSIGLYLNGAESAEVAYNLVIGTTDTVYEIGSGWHASGISIATEGPETTSGIDSHTQNNKVHNNIVINTAGGIRMYDDHDTYDVINNYIYNNTFIDNLYSFAISNPGDELDNTMYVGNNISYTPHADSTPAVVWGGSTLDNWTVDYNLWHGDSAPTGIWSGANDQTGDPKITRTSWRGSITSASNVTMPNLVLVVGSDAIDNGVDLGADYDNGWDPTTALPPTAVSLLDQDSFGNGWEIGAVVYNLYISNALPADNDTGVSTSMTITWDNPTGATSVTGYFDKETDANPPTTQVFVGSLTTSYGPLSLDTDTEYVFKINVVHTEGTETGLVYYFTTAGGPPASTDSGVTIVR